MSSIFNVFFDKFVKLSHIYKNFTNIKGKNYSLPVEN